MAISKSEYQAALSAFPAGVTIVTSRSATGEPAGATVSAFMALSLDPPLILVSLGKSSRTAAAIAEHGAFVVHFVSETTAHLAKRFASSANDKFAGLRSGISASGVPTLLDCEIRLKCSLHAQHAGGDHLIFIGHVDQAVIPPHPGQPVVWYDRQFRQLAEPAKETPAEPGKVALPEPEKV